jgi:leucyl-tRNA synthetase
MARQYDHRKIEKKWQDKWAESGIYITHEESDRPKSYVLDMFPYPSGEGLHVGHPKGYIAADIYARMKRMQGHNVLHPMGWDAFGLPAENFAIKNKIHPRTAVEKNIARFKEQLGKMGFDYDWSREINTTDPEYYKWTQWIFLKLYEKGLAYESHEPINWCPSCQTGLANEDLEDGKCERCGSVVEKKPMRQWVLKITDYAERLLADLELLPEWPENIKESQRNWIGKSEGALIEFIVDSNEFIEKIKIFTTRPDTIFGCTYVAVSPELAKSWIDSGWGASDEIQTYIDESIAERATAGHGGVKEKTGIDTGIFAVNPANQERVPVWITNYVLGDVGTGAIMAVPVHDERDHEFAEKFNLPIKEIELEKDLKEITKRVEGEWTTTYRLKDWVFSRQRYWGEPIPIIHCEKCGAVPVPEKDLPVVLPDVEHYEPTGTGESPLANISEWVNVKCPKCDGEGKRETNTMPQWAGSSWYYLRYMDPHNNLDLVGPDMEKYWAPVDVYVGGAEHATRHLIYARFWHKFLKDISVVGTDEPFTRLFSVGLIMAIDGKKMSKRYGNVINPDDIVETWGADTLRLYEMFMGPFTDSIAWSEDNMMGARRFIERVWRMQDKLADGEGVDAELHRTIKKVGDDIESFKFNTAISQMMIFVNKAEETGVTKEQYQKFLWVLAPFAPHMTEELWQKIGNENSIHVESWPSYDESKLAEETVIVVVQVNGKVRGEISVARGVGESDVVPQAQEVIKKWLEGNEIKRSIFVQDKLINFVIEK